MTQRRVTDYVGKHLECSAQFRFQTEYPSFFLCYPWNKEVNRDAITDVEALESSSNVVGGEKLEIRTWQN
jgi:hypothetical protein